MILQLDLRIMLWVWVMFSSLDLIRRNINRAVSDNLVGDFVKFRNEKGLYANTSPVS
jgi:hypothetical protein